MRVNRLFRRFLILSHMWDLNDILYWQSLLVLSNLDLRNLGYHQKIRLGEKMIKDRFILKLYHTEVVLTQQLLLLRVFDKEHQIFTTHPLRVIDRRALYSKCRLFLDHLNRDFLFFDFLRNHYHFLILMYLLAILFHFLFLILLVSHEVIIFIDWCLLSLWHYLWFNNRLQYQGSDGFNQIRVLSSLIDICAHSLWWIRSILLFWDSWLNLSFSMNIIRVSLSFAKLRYIFFLYYSWRNKVIERSSSKWS